MLLHASSHQLPVCHLAPQPSFVNPAFPSGKAGWDGGACDLTAAATALPTRATSSSRASITLVKLASCTEALTRENMQCLPMMLTCRGTQHALCQSQLWAHCMHHPLGSNGHPVHNSLIRSFRHPPCALMHTYLTDLDRTARAQAVTLKTPSCGRIKLPYSTAPHHAQCLQTLCGQKNSGKFTRYNDTECELPLSG